MFPIPFFTYSFFVGKSLLILFPVIERLIHHHKTEGFTFVITPLISLKNSQIIKFGKLNLPQPIAVEWKDLSSTTISKLFAPGCITSIQFIYLTPEATEDIKFRIFFKNLVGMEKVTRIVIDEAHNVVHSHYRPSYRSMEWMLKTVPVTMLSATIPQDEKFIGDLNSALGFESLLVRSPVICRPELSCRLIPTSSEKEARSLLERLVRTSVGNTIIYIPTIMLCVELCYLLVGSKMYHADMTLEDRRDVEAWWFSGDEKKIIIATSAFGEGIDSPNVTMVINYLIVQSMLDGLQQVSFLFLCIFMITKFF
jgi:ATP-dependent DNA helicase RecQ